MSKSSEALNVARLVVRETLADDSGECAVIVRRVVDRPGAFTVFVDGGYLADVAGFPQFSELDEAVFEGGRALQNAMAFAVAQFRAAAEASVMDGAW